MPEVRFVANEESVGSTPTGHFFTTEIMANKRTRQRTHRRERRKMKEGGGKGIKRMAAGGKTKMGRVSHGPT